jgi:diheme cytochrome c
MRLVLLLSALAFFNSACTGPGPANTSDTPVNETALARKLYVSKCAKCHKFYPPAKYSDEDWQMWMGKMSKKAKLNPEQQRILSNYIELAFRQPAIR